MLDIVKEPKKKIKQAKIPPPEPDYDFGINNQQEEDITNPKESEAKDTKPEQAPKKEEPQKKNKRTYNPWKIWKGFNKRQRLTAIIVAGVLLISGTAAGFAVFTKDPQPPEPVSIAPKKEEPPAPTTEPSRLTGVEIPIDLNKLPVTGIMIENSPDARPQSGLKDAGVIFEAIAEGGITRFLALFLESKPDYIGPVRSARPYYLDFLVPFDAAITHAGGSGQALAEIRSQGIKDIEHGQNGAAFQRVSTRYAPHNLYTSRDKLLEIHNKRGYETSTFTGFPRKAEKKLETPTAKTIDFNISGFNYNTHYDYDTTTNTYKRILGGKPHTDERSGEQLSPKVVIAIVTTHSYAGIYSVYGVTGSGKVFVYQDGGITEGTWQKSDRKNQYVFKTSDGKTLELNPGQTWITLIKDGGVKHSP